MTLNGVTAVILRRPNCPTLFHALYIAELLVQYSHISNVLHEPVVLLLYCFFTALFLVTKRENRVVADALP